MAHPLTRGFLASSFLILGAAASAASCTDQETSLYIEGVLQPEAPACVFKADAGSTLLGTGVVDRVFGEVPYTAALLVGNQLVQRSDPERLRVETSRISLEGAIVRVTTSTGTAIAEYTTPGTGFVNPGNGREPGRGVFFATLLPGSVGDPGQVYIAHVRVFGKTLGGVDVQSAEFLYTIEVCNGCLIRYPAAALDATGVCTAGPDVMVDPTCQFGVDEPVDCRLCSGSSPACKQAPVVVGP